MWGVAQPPPLSLDQEHPLHPGWNHEEVPVTLQEECSSCGCLNLSTSHCCINSTAVCQENGRDCHGRTGGDPASTVQKGMVNNPRILPSDRPFKPCGCGPVRPKQRPEVNREELHATDCPSHSSMFMPPAGNTGICWQLWIQLFNLSNVALTWPSMGHGSRISRRARLPPGLQARQAAAWQRRKRPF